MAHSPSTPSAVPPAPTETPPSDAPTSGAPPVGPRERFARLLRRRYIVGRDRWGTAAIAEMAIALVLCWVLGVFRPFQMPQGGSVSLEMLPIFFIAARRGLVPATVVGFLYGMMQIFVPLTPPFIYHPLQAVLDYPLAFAAVGLAGIVPVVGWRSLAVAVTLGSGARLLFHFLSGLIFFASYAPQWEWPWLYALTYNLLFLLPEAVITAVCLWPLLKAYDAARPGSGRRAPAPRDAA
jgi:thiamine transporter